MITQAPLRTLDTSSLPPGIPDFISREFWRWARLNAEVEILHVRFWLWKVTVTFRHLFPLFERIFGKAPA